jgi:predicted nucleic acid-binding protein
VATSVVPNGVVAEINVAPDDDPAKLWMVNEGARWIRDVEQVDPVIAAWDLGLGESHVLTWAYQHLGYQAILDDRAAKTIAELVGVANRSHVGFPHVNPTYSDERSH